MDLSGVPESPRVILGGFRFQGYFRKHQGCLVPGDFKVLKWFPSGFRGSHGRFRDM